MDRQTFAEIITSAWYTFEGLTQEEMIKDHKYKKENVEQGIKLCQALERKWNVNTATKKQKHGIEEKMFVKIVLQILEEIRDY